MVLLIVFFIKGQGLSLYTKLGLLFIFAAYPFVIYPIENALYQIYFYVYCVIYGESYATLMSRKGLQNPKNFGDITTLSQYIDTGIKRAESEAAPAITTLYNEIYNEIQKLPTEIQQKYTDIMGLVADMRIPENLADYIQKIKQAIGDFISTGGDPNLAAKIFVAIQSNIFIQYLQYYIIQVKQGADSSISNILDTYNAGVVATIEAIQTAISNGAVKTKSDIQRLVMGAVAPIRDKTIQLITDINSAAVSDETKNSLKTQISDAANTINSYMLQQFQVFGAL